MRYQISLHGIVGGEASIVAGQPGVVDGRSVVITRSRAESAGVAAAFKTVDDEVETWIDLHSGKPVFYHADVRFGRKEAVIQTHFGDGSFAIGYKHKGHPHRTFKQRMPEDMAAMEAHSALAALRGWSAAPGDRAYFFAVSGKRLWRHQVTMVGLGEVSSAGSKVQAFQIKGRAWRMTRSLTVDKRKKARSYTIWIAADAERKPVLVTAKTEYGPIKVELVEYSRPPVRLTSRER
jgi:hypothetical protein